VSIYSAVDAQTKKPVKQISAGIVNGKALTLPKPNYPEDARKAKLSGAIKVQVLIDEAGKVVSAKAISGLENISLRVAAEAAALNATFSPTLLSGQPVKVSGVIVYSFVAERSNEERLKVFGVSAFLNIVRSFVGDLDKFKEAFDETELFKDDIAEFGEFGPELKALESMEKMPVDKRLGAVDAALSSIHSLIVSLNSSTTSLKWSEENCRTCRRISWPASSSANADFFMITLVAYEHSTFQSRSAPRSIRVWGTRSREGNALLATSSEWCAFPSTLVDGSREEINYIREILRNGMGQLRCWNETHDMKKVVDHVSQVGRH
jgi:TonB family protein